MVGGGTPVHRLRENETQSMTSGIAGSLMFLVHFLFSLSNIIMVVR